MLFDREGLEMATNETIAHYHGSKFSGPVVDLTCGLGSDLIGLAATNSSVGYEIDPIRAEYARHNLAANRRSADIIVGDGLAAKWDAEYAFCDPSRRIDGKRTLRIEDFQPNPRAVADRFRSLKLGGIKLSPMLSDRDLESFGGTLEFISFGGECREVVVWLGSEAGAPRRLATHIESLEHLGVGETPSWAVAPDLFLFEADPAAIRAHCLGTLCSEFGLRALADSNGYLTGNELINSLWLEPFRVLATHNADLKRTVAELRRLGGGTPVVKSRGVKIDVDQLRRELRGDGEELVVVVYPSGPSLKHAICRRLS